MGYFLSHEFPIILAELISLTLCGVGLYYVIREIQRNSNIGMQILYGWIAIFIIFYGIWSINHTIKLLF